MINPHVTAADQRVKHRRVIAPIVLKKRRFSYGLARDRSEVDPKHTGGLHQLVRDGAEGHVARDTAPADHL